MHDKRFRKFQEMREVLDDRLAATFVVDVGCLDLATRRLTEWPEETREKAKALMTELPDYAEPRGLHREVMERDVSLACADAAGMIESNRSAVNPWECDTNAHMNARFIKIGRAHV